MIPPDLLSRSLVVGAAPEHLVALPEPLLDALLAGCRADAEARTWGEFREAAPGLHIATDGPDDAEAIGQADRQFEEAGYTVRRDDDISTACGY